MSTYISPSFQQSQYVSGVPLDLILQVGTAKQQQYNTVQSEFQNQLELYGSQDILKDSDRATINSALQNTVNKANSLADSNFSDPRVAAQLKGIGSELGANKDVQTIISNNKRARQFLNGIDDIKKNSPEQYNSANEAVAMSQFNKWYNDPTQNQFNASYTPYFDNTQAAKDLIKPLLDNPEISRQIEYYTDPTTGQQVKRGEREISEIRKDRVMQLLQSQLPEGAMRQFQIDYEASKPNLTTSGALNSIDSNVSTLTNSIDQLTQASNDPTILPNTKKAYEDKIKDLKDRVDAYQLARNKVVSTNDPTQYYTPNVYINDRLNNIADAYAYKNLGKLEDDFLFTNNIKHQDDLELARLNNQASMERTKYAADLSAAKQQAKLSAHQVNIANPFEQTWLNILDKGYGTAPSEQVPALFQNIGKQNDDGSYNIGSLQGKNFYISTAPELTQQEQSNQSSLIGYQDFSKRYQDWIKQNPSKITNSGPLSRDPKKYLGSPEAIAGIKSDSLKDFLATKEGQAALNESKKYGVDMTNTADLDNVRKIINSPENSILGEVVNKLKGSANFTVGQDAQGNNIISDNNGTPYVNMNLRLTKQDWIDRMNTLKNQGAQGALWFNSAAEDMFNKLESEKRLNLVSGSDTKNPVYELGVWVKPDLTPSQANDRYLRTNIFTGDKSNSVDVPIYNQHFDEVTSNAVKYRNALGNTNASNFGDDIIYNTKFILDQAKQSSEHIQQVAKLIEANRDVIKNPNISINDKLEAKRQLAAFVGVNSLEDIQNALISIQPPEVQSRILNSQSSSNTGAFIGSQPSTSQVESFQNIPSEYKNYINQASTKYGVPADVIQANMFQESGYNPNAKSSAGAIGLGQFMPETAKTYGVNRTDPKSSIEGMAAYLADIYKQTGDWNLAIAAYNAGENNPSIKSGKIPNIAETQNHVARVNYYRQFYK